MEGKRKKSDVQHSLGGEGTMGVGWVTQTEEGGAGTEQAQGYGGTNASQLTYKHYPDKSIDEQHIFIFFIALPSMKNA